MNKYIFELANGNGHSSCRFCGVTSWDCFMWKITNFENIRACDECKIRLEHSQKMASIMCKDYSPVCCKCPDCWAFDEANKLYAAGCRIYKKKDEPNAIQ